MFIRFFFLFFLSGETVLQKRKNSDMASAFKMFETEQPLFVAVVTSEVRMEQEGFMEMIFLT